MERNYLTNETKNTTALLLKSINKNPKVSLEKSEKTKSSKSSVPKEWMLLAVIAVKFKVGRDLGRRFEIFLFFFLCLAIKYKYVQK